MYRCLYTQVAANGICVVAVGVCGLWLHKLTDAQHRRTFLDTRASITAGVARQQETDRLVSEMDQSRSRYHH